MSETVYIGGFSGGIDSQAAARFMLNRYGPERVVLVNTESGRNELSLTVAHTRYYRAQVHPVEEVIPRVSDIWEDSDKPAEYGLLPDQELTFELLATIKGRFPSKRAQFCTENLKLRPIRRWVREHFPEGNYEYFTGVRRDESTSRKDAPFTEWGDFMDCPMLNQIADWTKEMCFAYVKHHGELINPLYTMGFGRVGCKCVNGKSKDEILALLRHFPEEIDNIRAMEKRTGFTYFAPCVPGMAINWIDEVVEWAKTDRGGRQPNMFRVLNEPASCESKFGLCE